MKKFLSLLFISFLGGIITLGSYKLFFEQKTEVVAEQATFPSAIPVFNNATNLKAAAENVDFTLAAEKTINSVVHVKNTTTSSGNMTFEDLFFGRRSQRPQIGTGSGVIISPDGLIITNNHVIDNAQEIEITTNDNKTFIAELVGTDPKTDIALLKIEADEPLPHTSFADSNNAKIGEWVLAVGNPFNLTSTVTAGIISAKSRDLSGRNVQSFIQTDAAVNPGNSGGALVNTNGDLIGINTAITSQTGSYIGYSFAVPSNIARKVVEDLIEFGNVQNGILGVTGAALNSDAADELNVDETEGFYVSAVEADSGAEKAGIQNGDIIKRLDNIEISKFSDMKGYLGSKRPDDVINVTILRDGNEKVIPVKLAKNMNVQVPIIGTLKKASENELNSFGVKQGLKVSRLNPYYSDYWKRNGIEEGVIVTSINDTKVNSVDDVERVLNQASEYEPLRLEIINKNGERERFNFKQ